MSSKRTSLRAWLCGMGISALLWLCLFAFADVYFAANDDQFLLRTFTGGSPTGAPTFHLYIHAMYAFPLSWLNRLFPGVAWVSIFEIALSWLGISVISKSIIQCFERRFQRRGFAMGLLGASCYTLLMHLYLCARPTYTTVAATLSAACVAQLLSIDCEHASDKQIIRSALFSLFLLALCCFFIFQTIKFIAMLFIIMSLLAAFSFSLGICSRLILCRFSSALFLILTAFVSTLSFVLAGVLRSLSVFIFVF